MNFKLLYRLFVLVTVLCGCAGGDAAVDADAILPTVWLGACSAAHDFRFLERAGIVHVLAIAPRSECDGVFAHAVAYTRLALLDVRGGQSARVRATR